MLNRNSIRLCALCLGVFNVFFNLCFNFCNLLNSFFTYFSSWYSVFSTPYSTYYSPYSLTYSSTSSPTCSSTSYSAIQLTILLILQPVHQFTPKIMHQLILSVNSPRYRQGRHNRAGFTLPQRFYVSFQTKVQSPTSSGILQSTRH